MNTVKRYTILAQSEDGQSFFAGCARMINWSSDPLFATKYFLKKSAKIMLAYLNRHPHFGMHDLKIEAMYEKKRGLITRRRLDQRRSRVGPKHDPYSRTQNIVFINDDAVSLIDCSLSGMSLRFNYSVLGRTNCTDPYEVESLENEFERLTGVHVNQFDELYQRFYVEDPMGCLADYM